MLRRVPLQLYDLVEQKEIRKQSPQMDRRVEVVDQLRADRGLGQYQLDRGQRVPRIAIYDTQKVLVGPRRFQAFLFHQRREGVRKPGERLHRTLQKIADPSASAATFFAVDSSYLDRNFRFDFSYRLIVHPTASDCAGFSFPKDAPRMP